jgi:hypothetical protein
MTGQNTALRPRSLGSVFLPAHRVDFGTVHQVHCIMVAGIDEAHSGDAGPTLALLPELQGRLLHCRRLRASFNTAARQMRESRCK